MLRPDGGVALGELVVGAGPSRARVRLDAAIDRVRTVGVVTIAGVLAGVVVGGIGSRVSMRISGALTRPEFAGIRTEGGNTVGVVSLEGTLALVIFGGVFAGLVGGVLYLALRPWLSRFGRWRGVAFGAYVLAVFGSAVIRGDNFDFRAFGPPWLNIVMYALMFPAFGALLVWGLDRIEPRVPSSPLRPTRRLRAWAAWAPVLLAALLAGLVLLGAADESFGQVTGSVVANPVFPGATVHVFLYLVLVVPLVRLVADRLDRGISPLIGAALLGWPVAYGLVLGWDSVTTILGL